MSWERVLQPPALGPGEVHVWRCRLDDGLSLDPALLSDDERARAARFRVDEARRRFVRRRSFLRRVLAGYTGLSAATLRFAYGAMGKPDLDPPVEGLAFNLSDSGPWAVVALSAGGPVGVDIEVMRPLDFTAIAAEVFSEAEQQELRSLPDAERTRAFFNGWTRKEALIKADGAGLAYPLKSFDVSLSPRQPPRLLRVSQGAAGWTLLSFDVAEGVIGAVAVQQPQAKLRTLELAAG